MPRDACPTIMSPRKKHTMLQDLWAFCEPSGNYIGGDHGPDTKESRTGDQGNIAALGTKARGADGHKGQRAKRGTPPIEERRDNREPEIVEGSVGDENGTQEKPEHPAIGANESYQPGRLALRVKEFHDERRGQTQKN